MKESDVWYGGARFSKFMWPKYEAEWQLATPLLAAHPGSTHVRTLAHWRQVPMYLSFIVQKWSCHFHPSLPD